MTADSPVASDWYQTFFTAPVMRFWEAAVPQQATDSEVAFILRHIGAHAPATLLDVPCGAGRHLLALAREGLTVTGVDLSQAALSRAEELAQSAGVRARLVRSDMTELEVNQAHDALICMGNSIGYFEPSLTRKLWGKLAGALRAGGRLILDTSICAESVLPLAAERSFSLPGCTYEQQITYDAGQSVINTRALLSIDGQRHELHYRHFVMTSGELVRSLSAAGFHIRGMYGDTQDGTFRPGSPRLLLVAERK